MKQIKYLATIGLIMFMLVACSSTEASKLSEWAVPDTEFPLAEPGPYYIGIQEYTIVDESRNGREIELIVWYPAQGKTDALSMRDAPVNERDAPYPLILTGHDTGGELLEGHLATHGFVMMEVLFPDYYPNWDFGIIDHPRDLLFALDQIAANPPEDLAGIIDTDQVGVTGYSWEGLYSLVLSGARIDPEYYLSHCEQAPTIQPALEEWYINYTCDLSKKWEAFAAHAGDEITASDDGLWQPVTDKRIRAVMPMGPEGAWLFGGLGLAAVDRPTLIIGATADDINPYDLEAAYIFEHLGTPERLMVSFVGQTHFMVDKPEQVKRMKHFVTAYFSYHLQGLADYAKYYSEDFVTQFDDLAWGVYKK